MDDRLNRFEVKNLKTMRGNEGDAFEATLYAGGKRAGVVWYDGWGGEYSFDGVPAAVLDELGAIGRDLYNASCTGSEAYLRVEDERKRMPDVAVEELVIRAEQAKERKALLRKAAKQVVFIFDGDNPDYSYRTFPARVAYMDAVRYLKTKYSSRNPRILDANSGKWEALS